MNASRIPTLTDKFTFGGLHFDEVYYPSGVRRPKHHHREVFLDLCLEGHIEEFWSAESFVRGESSLSLMPAGEPHATDFPVNVRTFQIVLTPPWMNRIVEYCAVPEVLGLYRGDAPNWLAARIYREFRQRDSVSPLMLEGMVLELLARIARSSPDRAENGCPRWLRQAKDYLHVHFTETLSLEVLAAAVGVHPSHLMRSFQGQYNCTIGEYVRRLRVEYACHLLTTSETPAAQIAVEAGFVDQSHFSRTIKRITGMNPTEFRKITSPSAE